jgi:hypothetical protein
VSNYVNMTFYDQNIPYKSKVTTYSFSDIPDGIMYVKV